MRVNRSTFVAASVAAASALLTRSPAGAAEFTYKLAHPNPVDFPPHIRMVQMAQAIKAETNGRMDIQIFPNAVLGGTTALVSQLRAGAIQLLQIGNPSWSGVVPASALESVGFAFKSTKQALDAMDGALGEYIRKDFAAKSLYAFRRPFDLTFSQTTSSSKPIRTAADFAGIKLRTPASPIVVDFFRALGASPVPLDSKELYTALQTHIVDGQESPITVIESFRLYEVQKYLSYTNHKWTGSWLVANAEAWTALPPDIRATIERNVEKAVAAERRDMQLLNGSVGDKLHRQGLSVNITDTTGIRSNLGAYYSKWRGEFGPAAWGLLEGAAGKLG